MAPKDLALETGYARAPDGKRSPQFHLAPPDLSMGKGEEATRRLRAANEFAMPPQGLPDTSLVDQAVGRTVPEGQGSDVPDGFPAPFRRKGPASPAISDLDAPTADELREGAGKPRKHRGRHLPTITAPHGAYPAAAPGVQMHAPAHPALAGGMAGRPLATPPTHPRRRSRGAGRGRPAAGGLRRGEIGGEGLTLTAGEDPHAGVRGTLSRGTGFGGEAARSLNKGLGGRGRGGGSALQAAAAAQARHLAAKERLEEARKRASKLDQGVPEGSSSYFMGMQPEVQKEVQREVAEAGVAERAAGRAGADAYSRLFKKENIQDNADRTNRLLKDEIARQRRYLNDQERREQKHYERKRGGEAAKRADRGAARARTARDVATSAKAESTRLRNDVSPQTNRLLRTSAKLVKAQAKEAKRAAKELDKGREVGASKQSLEKLKNKLEAADSALAATEMFLDAVLAAARNEARPPEEEAPEPKKPSDQRKGEGSEQGEEGDGGGPDSAGTGSTGGDGGPTDAGDKKTEEEEQHTGVYPDCGPCKCEPPCEEGYRCSCHWGEGDRKGRGPDILPPRKSVGLARDPRVRPRSSSLMAQEGQADVAPDPGEKRRESPGPSGESEDEGAKEGSRPGSDEQPVHGGARRLLSLWKGLLLAEKQRQFWVELLEALLRGETTSADWGYTGSRRSFIRHVMRELRRASDRVIRLAMAHFRRTGGRRSQLGGRYLPSLRRGLRRARTPDEAMAWSDGIWEVVGAIALPNTIEHDGQAVEIDREATLNHVWMDTEFAVESAKLEAEARRIQAEIELLHLERLAFSHEDPERSKLASKKLQQLAQEFRWHTYAMELLAKNHMGIGPFNDVRAMDDDATRFAFSGAGPLGYQDVPRPLDRPEKPWGAVQVLAEQTDIGVLLATLGLRWPKHKEEILTLESRIKALNPALDLENLRRGDWVHGFTKYTKYAADNPIWWSLLVRMSPVQDVERQHTVIEGRYGSAIWLENCKDAIVCHGVSARGIVGPPNSFGGAAFPGGKEGLEGLVALRDLSAGTVQEVGGMMLGGLVRPIKEAGRVGWSLFRARLTNAVADAGAYGLTEEAFDTLVKGEEFSAARVGLRFVAGAGADLSISYIPWSRLFRRSSAAGQILSGRAAITAGSRVTVQGGGGVAAVAEGSAPRFVHLTSSGAAEQIAATQVLRGRHGIFALEREVAERAGTVERVLRTGLSPENVEVLVPIPEAASGLFRRPWAIGPYSAWKRFGGTYFAEPGTIALAPEGIVGAFAPSSTILGPRTLIYGPDIAGYAMGGGMGVYLVTRDSRK